MSRNLIWSIIIHAVVIIGGAQLAPMGGLFDASSHPLDIISVGLVDAAPRSPGPSVPMPQIAPPTPAVNDAVGLKPEADLSKEEVPPEEKPEPLGDEDDAKPNETPEKDEPDVAEKEPVIEEKPATDTVSAQQLADATADVVTDLSVTEGSGSDDVWGFEADARANPYHRRGSKAIYNNWRNPATGPRPLQCTVRFRVSRSGRIDDIELKQSSGSVLFDNAALRAVRMTRQWDPFPKFWEEDAQYINMHFEYRP